MLQYIQPTIYLLLLAYAVWQYPRLRSEGVPRWGWVLLLVLKCVLGIAYIQLHQELYGGGDTSGYIRDGRIIFGTLTEDPLKYLRLTFGPNGTAVTPWLAKEIDAMGFWGDTGAYSLVRFNAFANLATWGNQWSNAILMAFVSYGGLLLLFKSFQTMVSNRWWLFFGLVCIPSTLFWTSGIHKESLALFTLSLAIYGMAHIYLHGWEPRNMLFVALGLVGTYLVRDFLVLLLLPLLLAQVFSPVFNSGRVWVYAAILTAALFVGAYLPLVNGQTVLQLIGNKQEQFAALRVGQSHITLPNMEPTLKGFATTLPAALYNQFVAPFSLRRPNALYYIAIVDHAWFMIMLIVGLLFIRKPLLEKPPLLTVFFFGLILFVIIGLIVPNIGAMLRYRSLALPFLLMPLLVGRKILD